MTRVHRGVHVERGRESTGCKFRRRALRCETLRHRDPPQVGLNGDECVSNRRGCDADDGRRSGTVEFDVVAVIRRSYHVLRRGGRDNRGHVSLLRRRPRAVSVHDGNLLAHHRAETPGCEPVEGFLYLDQRTPSPGHTGQAHGVKSRVHDEHHRVVPERLVKLTNSNQENLPRMLRLDLERVVVHGLPPAGLAGTLGRPPKGRVDAERVGEVHALDHEPGGLLHRRPRDLRDPKLPIEDSVVKGLGLLHRGHGALSTRGRG
mmetsp:Transcript_5561/g.25029  ORF Transcript_5561/g.25029 Transcript_5561/m.25029 type:complete len:261 (-) Transcript_5561:290-1072(-)